MLTSSSKLRRILTSGLLIVGLLASSLTPAQAIFGLSKCEKVIKALNFEEEIGYENWKKYDNYRDLLVSRKYFTYGAFKTLLKQLNIVYSSDKKIYNEIDKNSKCFSSKFNSVNREVIIDLQDSISQTNNMIDSINKFSGYRLVEYVTPVFKSYATSVYSEFLNWETRKIKIS